MKLLLDTHTLLWLASGDVKLTQPARKAIADPANTLTISVATIWELAIKTTKSQNPLRLSEPLDIYLAKCLATYGIDVLPILQPHALGVIELPDHHRDPFDRIMIAIELDGLCWILSDKTSGIGLEDAGLGLAELIAGREPHGVDFLAGVGAGRAKLLLSRIPAASAAPISAAP